MSLTHPFSYLQLLIPRSSFEVDNWERPRSPLGDKIKPVYIFTDFQRSSKQSCLFLERSHLLVDLSVSDKAKLFLRTFSFYNNIYFTTHMIQVVW